MKLIVNADDFGLSPATNYGILKAFTDGIVRSTTLMVNMRAVDHALELSKANPALGIGIHMVLTAGEPILPNCKTIVDKDGSFHKQLTLFSKLEDGEIDAKEVYAEWKAQIEKALDAGFRITHLDSHHHVHLRPELLSTSVKLSQDFKLPIRAGKNESSYRGLGIDSTDYFSMEFYGNDLKAESLIKIIDSYKKSNGSLEVMAHPAYIDKALYSASSYSLQRLDELEILTSPEVKAFIKTNNIELLDYGALHKHKE